MKNKKWIVLLIFGLLLITLIPLSNIVKATEIYYKSFDNYNGQSGYIETSNVNFTNLINAISGGHIHNTVKTFVNIGYSIQRGFLFFNTSSLPDDCIILGFNLSFYIAYKEGSSPFVYMQSANLGDTLSDNDFDKNNYNTLFSRFSIPLGYHYYKFCFGLNVSNMINKIDLSCFVLRNSDDYLGIYNTEYFWEITNMSTISLCVIYAVDSCGTSGTFALNTAQFFLILCLSLWLLFLFKYIDSKEIILLYVQLGLQIPLVITISATAFIMSAPFGYIFCFVIPLISIYFFADYFNEENKKKKNKR